MTRLSILAVAAACVPAIAAAQAPKAPAPVSIVPMPVTQLPLKHTAKPTTAAITASDLMSRLYIFADDSMMGREAGTIGNVKGTDYIAAEARKIGLVPAGENGTYFQTIPLKTRTIDTTSTLSVGGVPLAIFSDYAPVGPTPLSSQALQIVYGGALGDTAHMLSAADAKGKFVVLSMPEGMQSLMRGVRAGARGLDSAAAVAIVGLDVLPPQYMTFFKRPATFMDNKPAGAPTAPTVFLVSTAAATKMFDKPLDQLTPGTAGKSAAADFRVNVVPVPFPARNVVGIIPGSDPKLKGEYVAVGAHNDHIGTSTHPVDHDSVRIFNHIVRPKGADDGGNRASAEQQAEVNKQLAAWRAAHPKLARTDSISNGADDDGSGTVSVLEIAQKIAAMPTKPKRSTIFVWHVGEEKGLLGSQYFTDNPTVPRDSIVAQLNIDMIGRGDAYDVVGDTKDGTAIHGSPNYLQLVGSRRLSTELGDIVEAVNKSGKHNVTFDYSIDADGHPANIYCRSDHYEYARYGIPVTFFTTGLHSDYHQVSDEPQYIDYAHMARVANLVEDIAVHVANLDHRVVVDHPKPDPHGSCRQ